MHFQRSSQNISLHFEFEERTFLVDLKQLKFSLTTFLLFDVCVEMWCTRMSKYCYKYLHSDIISEKGKPDYRDTEHTYMNLHKKSTFNPLPICDGFILGESCEFKFLVSLLIANCSLSSSEMTILSISYPLGDIFH